MTCTDAQPMLAPAADGALDEARQARLDAHLAACASCRAALEDQRHVAAILAAVVRDEVSATFAARVNERIDEAESWVGLADFRAWTLRLAPLAAAAALIAYLGLGARTAPATSSTASSDAGTVATFSPTNAADWNRDVTADALLEAALGRAAGDVNAR